MNLCQCYKLVIEFNRQRWPKDVFHPHWFLSSHSNLYTYDGGRSFTSSSAMNVFYIDKSYTTTPRLVKVRHNFTMKYTVRLFKNTTVRLYNVLFSKCTANFVTFWFIFCDGLGYFFWLKVHSLSQRADIFYFSCMMGILLSLVPRCVNSSQNSSQYCIHFGPSRWTRPKI